MRQILQIVFNIVFVLSFIFVFSTAINAQILSGSRLFLEVVDSNQKPVSDAKVEMDLREQQQVKYTDAWGECKFWFRKDILPRFTITKPDYYPFYDFGEMLYGGGRNIKVELLKIPQTNEKNKALESEQSKREFLRAIQKGDVESARKFIESGISPNLAITDLRGVSGYENTPAILYPARAGDGAMLKLLLEKGADVRGKDKYLSYIFLYYFQANPLMNKKPRTESEKEKLVSE